MKKVLFVLTLFLSTIICNAQIYTFQVKNEKTSKLDVKIDISQKEVTILNDGTVADNFNYIYTFVDIPQDDGMENYEKLAKTKLLLYTSKDSKPDTDLDEVTEGEYGNCCLISIDGIAIVTGDEKEDEWWTRLFKPVVKRDYIKTFGKLELTLIGYND